MNNDASTLPGFDHFGLKPALIRAIIDLGFETPTSIQEQTIKLQLDGKDILGQAQTGTGKTAAYALPLLNDLDVSSEDVKVLVLTPTRELAIQVSEAFEQFAKHIDGLKILPVYGGADMGAQLRALKRGVHIVVGTPGRVMDHMRRKTLNLDKVSDIVLDEADEMLNMGFQEDVDWILEQSPENRQMALFSATIPAAIRQIAKRFMHDPQEVTVKTKTTTAATIHQRYWMISGMHKLDALSRILEVEDYDGVIVFVRTRAATVELAQDLEDRGFSTAALNGDIPQHTREQTIDRLKSKRIDILVATDVAARGLDVERISHVINYDLPHDAEAYVHRVGRTGRAGRNGEAILFISPRDRHVLRVIERTTRQEIEEFYLPKAKQINELRIASFKKKITDKIESGSLDLFKKIIQELKDEAEYDPVDIAAAAASIIQGDKPLLLVEKEPPVVNRTVLSRYERRRLEASQADSRRKPESKQPESRKSDRATSDQSGFDRKHGRKERQAERLPEFEMAQYRVEVGLSHGLKPGNLLGAITNEAGLDGNHVGKIVILDDFSTVDLPVGMPSYVLQYLRKVWVSGQQLRISLNEKSPKQRGDRGGRGSRDDRSARGEKKLANGAKPKLPHQRRGRRG